MVIELRVEEADYLAELEANAEKAVAMRDAAFTMLIRGRGLLAVKNPQLDGLKLTVEVAD